jgi:rare lipoprotein A
MFVPATPAQPAPTLAPVGVVSTEQAMLATPVHTTIKVHTEQLNVLEDHATSITGKLLEERHDAIPGRIVALQVLGDHGWQTLARARTARHGRFRLSFRPRRTGSRQLRLRFQGDATAASSRKRLGTLNVFRLALASWYGGGGTTACGGQLTSYTMGVANKTLPCGTMVTLRYGSNTVRVPVIDRGPYVEGREFDLTEATKSALGFGGVGEVWSTD